jgi:hypothetical protein
LVADRYRRRTFNVVVSYCCFVALLHSEPVNLLIPLPCDFQWVCLNGLVLRSLCLFGDKTFVRRATLGGQIPTNINMPLWKDELNASKPYW